MHGNLSRWSAEIASGVIRQFPSDKYAGDQRVVMAPEGFEGDME